MKKLSVNALRDLLGAKGSLRFNLARAASGSALLAISSKLLMVVTSVVLARWMGAEEYGVYAAATGLAVLLTVPTGLGLPVLLVRILPEYALRNEWGLMRGLLVGSNRVVLCASVSAAAASAGVMWVCFQALEVEDGIPFYIALSLLPVVALSAVRSASLRGLHYVILGQLPESAIFPGCFLLFIVAAGVGTGGAENLSASLAVGLRVLAAFTAFCIGFAFLASVIPANLRSCATEYDWKRWRRSAIPLLFIAGVHVVNAQADILMLAALQGSESAGVYQAAVRGADLAVFSLIIVNMAIEPSLARLYAEGDQGRLQRVVVLGARVAVLGALLPSVIMIVWSADLLRLVFGEGFERGAHSLVILVVAQLINAATGPTLALLNMSGFEAQSLRAMVWGVGANIGLNAMLIPSFDIVGAAFATALSILVWNVLLVTIAKKKLRINTAAFARLP